MFPQTTESEADPLEAARARRARLLPWVLLLLGLAGTLWVFGSKREDEYRVAGEQFDARVGELRAAIAGRLESYAQMLRGCAGLLLASDDVTRQEWHRYVEQLRVDESFPGVQGLGYAVALTPDQVAPLEAQVRAEGFGDFSVYPPGPRDLYTAIIYLEPFDWRNRRAFGYDMFSEPVRHLAMKRARDTGEPSMSGKIILRQETREEVQPGFLVYLPVYRGGGLPPRELREQQLRGFVYAPFRMYDFMAGLLPPEDPDIELRIYDGAEPSGHALLYDSHPPAVGRGDARAARFREQFTLDTLGHTWTLTFRSRPGFEARLDRQTPGIVLFSGSLVSLLLFFLAWSLSRTQRLAIRLAGDMSAESRERASQLREITATMGEGVYVVDNEGRITFSNPAVRELVGWGEEELLGAPAHDLFHQHGDDSLSLSRCPYQRATALGRTLTADDEVFRHRNGGLRPVAVIASPIVRESGVAGAVVAIRDISQRKSTESALRESERFRLLFEYSREALLLVDRGGRVADVNRLVSEGLGYSRGELVGDDCDRIAAPPPEGEPSFCTRLRTASEGTPSRFEWELLRRDGGRFPVEVVASPLELDARKLLLVSMRDISERREAEQGMRRAMEATARAKAETERVNVELARTNAELQRLSQVDGLTGIANRRYFDHVLEVEWARALRDRDPLSLIILDVDFFKAYNDHYGHQAGDDCLRRIATVLSEQLGRPSDFLARYGGEEFVVVLPQTHAAGALHIAETLRQAVEGLRLAHEHSEAADHVTISLGVGTAEPAPGLEAAQLIAAADSALYEVKRTGRNRVLLQRVEAR